jgi:hypothetical protein
MYQAEVKEVFNDTLLKPSYSGKKMTKDDLVKFWGLNEPDIEWYNLYEVDQNGNRKMMK